MKTILTALLVFVFAAIVNAQADTLQSSSVDTAQMLAALDSANTAKLNMLNAQQSFLNTNDKPVIQDVQQHLPAKRSLMVFTLLILMLGALTYIKSAFNKDLEELIQSMVNQNISQQIFRTGSGEITFSSVLLNLNFVVGISLYVRFIFINYFHVSSLEGFSATLFIIFLFTFFYLLKILVVKLVGAMFELNDVCDEYIFNFTSVCKTLGLTLLPALFIFYTAQEKFFNFIFIITILICVALVLLLVWRGLSTGSKLMYRSVYHFFIYVCVVEISPIFLLFKLLTKTII